MRRILLLPKIKIQNANALSSPYTIGFPAMTAWLGGVHALQRKLNQHGYPDIRFKHTGVISHDFNLQTYKGKNDHVDSIIGTSNPLNKDGSRPAFIEEARCHLVVSLLIELEDWDINDRDAFMASVRTHLATLKLAGGDILLNPKNSIKPELVNVSEEEDLKKLIRKIMPGYFIAERRNLVINAMKQGQDPLDAILDYLKIMHRSKIENKKVTWLTPHHLEPGWIVPLAVGFQGISSLGHALNQRDPNTAHRFAESIITLGEFKMAYKAKHLDELLWQSHVEEKNNLYICKQLKSLT